jgi:hypothetical protein
MPFVVTFAAFAVTFAAFGAGAGCEAAKLEGEQHQQCQKQQQQS